MHLPHSCHWVSSLQIMQASSVVVQWEEQVQRKESQLPSSLLSSASAAWEAPVLLDTTLTWGCQGCESATEVTSTDKRAHRRMLRRNTVLAKDATREYHTSILAKNIGEVFTPTWGRAIK